MSEHTPEPWMTRADAAYDAALDKASPETEGNCWPVYPADANPEEDEVTLVALTWVYNDARRIVACVNFCVGKPTEWLEGTTLEDLMLKEYEGSHES